MDIIRQRHSGQVALIMVLIMTVISAVAISLASRSTVETRVQQMETENTQAMLAAQAGLEQSVSTGVPVTGTLVQGQDYKVTVDTEGTTGVLTDKLNPGETVEINLDGVVTLTGVRVYWRPADVSTTPSIFVSDIRDNLTNDYGFDTLGANGFTQVASGGNLNGVTFNYVIPAPISVSVASTKTVRVTVLGAPAFVGVEPVGGQFPPQTKNYKSVGNVGSGDSQIKYGIEYKESATSQVPSVFDYALFSKGSIIQ